MNCLHNLPRFRSSFLPLPDSKCCANISPCVINRTGVISATDRRRSISMKATNGSTPVNNVEGAKVEEEKSDEYSNNMTEAMGAVLTYRHELGMNYNFIRPDLIVGSCLQTPADVDKLRVIGVKTIFCLQKDSDLEYFDVDINAIREYAGTFDDIQHLRAEIRDFDAFDLRLRLPAVVSKLHKAVNRNGGVTYIHCTAGLGRAPATALAYMFWVQGYNLKEAVDILLGKRFCFPKLEAIKSATADILTGRKKKPVTLTWNGDNCSTVEISGLDIGWGPTLLPGGSYWICTVWSRMNEIGGKWSETGTISWKIPLSYDEEQGLWVLHRELPEGRYEYKYVVDGEWLYNKDEPVTPINKDGHINNYVQVSDDNPESITAKLRERLMADEPDLTKNERLIIRQFLEACPDDE